MKRPSRKGFGTRLVTDGIPLELGGEVKLECPADGVTRTFDVTLGHPAEKS